MPILSHDPSASLPLLVVDDEQSITRVLSRWLNAAGYECHATNSPFEALRLMREREYALVVSDIMMPEMGGLALLECIRAESPHAAVLMVTGVDDRDTAIRALSLGAYGYVIKPFEQNEVIINVASALERRRLSIESETYQLHLEALVRERTQDIRRTQEEITMRLAAASECRDAETGVHIRRMAEYVKTLADALGWNPKAVDDISIAAPMHDIGKMGVPDGILRKPDKLEPQEFEIMKTHTDIGARILGGSGIALLEMAREIAAGHHEWWDGSGYPHGLAGEAIPQPARLVAVADVFDALVSDRVYRRALPFDEAVRIMRRECARHFCPETFQCFLSILPRIREINERLVDEANGNGVSQPDRLEAAVG